jgi:hypothetical protein
LTSKIINFQHFKQAVRLQPFTEDTLGGGNPEICAVQIFQCRRKTSASHRSGLYKNNNLYMFDAQLSIVFVAIDLKTDDMNNRRLRR